MATSSLTTEKSSGPTVKALDDFKDKFEKLQDGLIDAEEFKSARLGLGVYSQRQKGLSMVRTKIAAGILQKEALPKIARAAETYADGTVHITTRQDLQFHFVKMENIHPLLVSLHETGITSLGAGGNTIRNVTVCDHGQTFSNEILNVAPVAKAVSDWFLGREYSKGLPRKFKITFCGSPDNCSGGLVDCIAAVAAFSPDGSSSPGFKIFAGGGLGAVPRFAALLEDFVPADKINRTILAVLRVFNRHGTRINRNRARLKFLIEKIGFEKFKELYLKELDLLTDIEPLDIDINGLTKISDNDVSVSTIARIPTGDINSGQLVALHDLLSNLNGITIKTTKNADLYFGGVPADRLNELSDGIASIGFETVKPGGSYGVVSCNGAFACNEGITNSKALGKRLEKYVYETQNGMKLRVSVSGCPNACGNHHAADIGLQGSAKKVNGILVPHYQLYLGGTLESEPKFSVPIIKIPAKKVIDAVGHVVGILREQKRDGESVRQLLERVGAEYFENELARFTSLEKYDDERDSYLDWDSEQEFSLEDVGPGECAGAALDIIDGYFNLARHDIASARKADDARTILRSAHNGLVQSAKALLVTYGIDPETEAELFREFNSKIITRGFMPETYRSLLTVFNENDVPSSIDGAFEKLYETEKFMEDCLAAYTRINPNANLVDEGHEEVKLKRMDLSGVACPFNYIKVKLALEGVNPGTRLEVLLDSGQPIKNVPQSLQNDGHKIISNVPVNGQFMITVEKV